MAENRTPLGQVLRKFIDEKRTGLLAVKGEYGFQASIYLSRGVVIMLEDGKLYGAPAAKNIAKRINLRTEFHENQAPGKRVNINFTTEAFVNLLSKAETAFDTFSKSIPSLEAVFRLNKDRWGKEDVNPKDLQILMLLDGQRTVRQTIAECGYPELDVLHTIFGYHARGLVVRLSGDKPMNKDVCRQLKSALQEKLADIIGPAAETIIDDAFETINASPDYLSQSELPALYDAVRRHLDHDECADFDDWVKGDTAMLSS